MRAASTFVLTAGLLLLGTAACGLPDDDHPRAIAAEDIPLPAGAGTTTTTAPATGSGSRIEIWLVNDAGTLRSIDRSVETRSVQVALDTLLTAPTEAEDAGYNNMLPEGTTLAATEEGSVARIQLGPSGTGLLGIQGDQQLRAFAQVVLTATGIVGIDSVLFVAEDGTTPVEVPTQNRSVLGPVTADDYLSLRR